MYNQIIYQIYPLGFTGAPKENDGVTVHRILQVIDWIEHFKKLGITAILFNPVFSSDRHGYDTNDFTKIDCRLGTNEDFVQVCKALHEANIKVILDGVFNHVGRGFPYFQDIIQKRYDSPYLDWFHVNLNDGNGPDGFWYEGWEGHQELVKLNLDNPEVREYLITQVENWITLYGIDGLRLDVAYMVNQNFMHELCDRIRAKYPDFFFVGEMIGGDYNVLMNDHLLDSVTNYECRKGLYSSFNTHNLFEIGFSLNRQFGSEQWCLYTGKHLLSFVDNHDVNRIASELNDARDLPLIYALMYAMPGIPCIYYGSEWGIEGKRTNWSDDDLRPYIEKPSWNDLTTYLAKLNQIRTENLVFTDGDYKQVYLQNQQIIFSRKNEEHTLYFVLNIADVDVDMPLSIGTAKNLLTGEEVEINGSIHLQPKECYFFLQ